MSMKSLVFFFVFTSSTLALAEDPYGIFMVVKGEVKVARASAETVKAKVGLRIVPGDTVISGEDARARIAMYDRNMIFVSPKTKFTIEKYTAEKNGVKNVELKLDEGKVLNNVEQKYDGDKSKFLIKTPTAVAGVRGTIFFTSFDTKTRVTEVITQTGSVTLSGLSASGAVTGTVTVDKGQGSSVNSGSAAPEPPKPVPPEQMKKIDSDVKGTAPAAPSAPSDSSGGSKGDKKSDEGKKSGSTSTAGNSGDGFRMNDKNDTSPDAVDKVPAGQNPTLAPLPISQVPNNKPPTRTLTPDAVRGKTDKTNVKIIPVTK